MTKEEYKKLNDYLNIIFKQLEKNDYFFLENLCPIGYLNESFLHFIKQYELQENKEENYLSYEDVYNIAREIISNFNSEYLEEYDKLIEDGTIDFNYEKDGSGCCSKLENDRKIINIERIFNYTDVVNLIHEFIHHTNSEKNVTINRYLLTEFLSIYFEIYAQQYLIEHYHVSKDSIGINDRMKDSIKGSKSICWYFIPFNIYFNTGNIDENSYQFTKYFVKEEKESFDDECRILLKNCEKEEQKYRRKILYEKEFKENEFAKELVYNLGFTTSYRYLLGTILAYYAIDHVDVKNIVSLNNFVNSDESANMSIYNLLYKFGIDLNGDFVNKAFNTISEMLKDKKKTR